MRKSGLYGLLIEFEDQATLLAAARQVHAEGYRKVDAYSPFPVEGLAKALGRGRTGVPAIVLIGGLVGATAGYYLQYWVSAIDYPLNIGGRPYHSWPMFVPITFELMVLFAAIFGVVGTLALNGLPQPYHPVFNVPEFGRATVDRFFLCIEAGDPKFERRGTEDFLGRLNGVRISEVEW
jgi:hypothetical protein